MAFAVGDGVFFMTHRDVDIGILVAEVELGELRAFVEADDGVVEGLQGVAVAGGDSLGQGHFQTSVIGIREWFRCAEDDVFVVFHFDNDTIAGLDGCCFIDRISHDDGTVVIQCVIRLVDVCLNTERVAHEVVAIGKACDGLLAARVERAGEGQGLGLLGGVEVALTVDEVEVGGMGVVVLPHQVARVQAVEVEIIRHRICFRNGSTNKVGNGIWGNASFNR